MRNGSCRSLSGWQAGDPTREDIAAECLRIRSTWSQREHYVRAGKRPPAWLCRRDDLHAENWTAPAEAVDRRSHHFW
jgi:hypothetical protein